MTINLFWRCEGTTLDGTDDHSAGDTTATPVGTPAINAVEVWRGTNSLDIPAGTDYYSFDSAGIAVPAQGSMSGVFYVDTWVDGAILMQLRGADANDHVRVALAGGDELSVNYQRSGGDNVTLTTVGANMVVGNWYAFEARWDAGRITVTVYTWAFGVIWDFLATTTSVLTLDPPATYTLIECGNSSAAAADFRLDNLLVSDDSLEDYQGNGQDTALWNLESWSAAQLGDIFRHKRDTIQHNDPTLRHNDLTLRHNATTLQHN